LYFITKAQINIRNDISQGNKAGKLLKVRIDHVVSTKMRKHFILFFNLEETLL